MCFYGQLATENPFCFPSVRYPKTDSVLCSTATSVPDFTEGAAAVTE